MLSLNLEARAMRALSFSTSPELPHHERLLRGHCCSPARRGYATRLGSREPHCALTKGGLARESVEPRHAKINRLVILLFCYGCGSVAPSLDRL